MKPLTIILSLLLIAYSSQTTFILTNFQVENDSTTKTTAKITCASRGDHTGIAFVNNSLKIAGNDASNKTDKKHLYEVIQIILLIIVDIIE